MSIINELSCFCHIQDGIVQIGKVAETLEMTFFGNAKSKVPKVHHGPRTLTIYELDFLLNIRDEILEYGQVDTVRANSPGHIKICQVSKVHKAIQLCCAQGFLLYFHFI